MPYYEHCKAPKASVCLFVMPEARREAGGCPQHRHAPARSEPEPATTTLFHFYKSSSAQREKSRPVAIFSTTLQRYSRCHLNAACAVCARNYTNAERRRGGKTNPNGFEEASLPADVPGTVWGGSEPLFLRVCRIHGEGEGTGTTRRKRGGGGSSNCALDAPKAKLVESY